MNIPALRLSAVLATLALGLSVNAHAAKNEWDRIDLEGPIDITLSDGSTRTLEPSCSGGPKPSPTGPVPANTDFYFFVQKGNSNRLLFGLDGGGACWDALTCIGSPLAGQSTYTQELDETAEGLAQTGGIFDARNPENPFANYTKIFIPYCSADIHWGSKDTEYTLGPITWTIHHRGSDNFLAVLDWLKKNGRAAYNIDFDRARDVMVTGASAGPVLIDRVFGNPLTAGLLIGTAATVRVNAVHFWPFWNACFPANTSRIRRSTFSRSSGVSGRGRSKS